MKNSLKNIFIFFIYFLLYSPIIFIIIYSFNDAKYSMIISKLTAKWYYEILNNDVMWHSFYNSILLAIASSTVSVFFATLTVITLFIKAIKNSSHVYSLFYLLIIIPDIILAVSFLVFFNAFNIKLGFVSLLISHVVFSLPFALVLVKNQLQKTGPNIYNAAQDLGSNHFYCVRKILIPLLKSSLISAWLICFTLSFDDVLISYFTSGPSFQILPLYIYSLIRNGVTPELNALCTLVFLFSFITTSSAYVLLGKSNK